jgi:hypothetical protein
MMVVADACVCAYKCVYCVEGQPGMYCALKTNSKRGFYTYMLINISSECQQVSIDACDLS